MNTKVQNNSASKNGNSTDDFEINVKNYNGVESIEIAPLSPGKRRLVFAAIMATTFMAAVEIHIVATAMPSILPELGGFHLYSWVFGGFVLTQAVTTPIYGKLADIYGRRRILATGIIIFLISSLLCGLATNMPELIIYRGLQGVGAGAILPVAHTIVGDIYTPEQRARVQGQLATVWAISAIAGPAFGAVIISRFEWPWVFWINIPLGILSLVMIQVFYREVAQNRKHKIDYLGAMLLMFGSASFMLVMLQGANWPIWFNITLVIVAFLAIVALVIQEKRAPEPILSIQLVRNPMIMIGVTAGAILGAELMVILSFMPAHFQGVLGASANAVAIALVAMSLTWSACAAIGGRLMIRTSYRTNVITGATFLIMGCTTLSVLPLGNDIFWLTLAATLVGAGMGFSHTTYIIAVQSSVDYLHRGIATSTLYFSRMLGQAIGAAVFGSIINAGIRGGPPGSPENVESIMDPIKRASINSDELNEIIELLADSLQNAYIVALALAFTVLILATRVARNERPTDYHDSSKPS